MSSPNQSITYDMPKRLVKTFESFQTLTENKSYALYHVTKLAALLPSLECPLRTISRLFRAVSKALKVVESSSSPLFEDGIDECYMADPLAQMQPHKGSTMTDTIEDARTTDEKELTIEFADEK